MYKRFEPFELICAFSREKGQESKASSEAASGSSQYYNPSVPPGFKAFQNSLLISNSLFQKQEQATLATDINRSIIKIKSSKDIILRINLLIPSNIIIKLLSIYDIKPRQEHDPFLLFYSKYVSLHFCSPLSETTKKNIPRTPLLPPFHFSPATYFFSLSLILTNFINLFFKRPNCLNFYNLLLQALLNCNPLISG